MAKMIPANIDDKENKSCAERMVFEWLSNKEIKGTAYYSLLQKNHTRKIIGEVDFLFVCERGVLCLEVKGGQEIKRAGQKWSSKKRTGEWVPIKDPFWQAIQCMNAARDYLADTFGKDSECANSVFGYAVIFPECIFNGDCNDIVSDVLFDCKYKLDEFPDFIKRVFDYWENELITKQDIHPVTMSMSSLGKANEVLRGDFSCVPSMSLQLEHIERKMIELTSEQYEVLEAFNDNPRMLIFGAAGTGKSLIALEQARRSIARGKKTLLLCFNSNIARYAKINLSSCDDNLLKVATFHAFMQEIIGTQLFDKSLTDISETFKDSSPNYQTFDLLIIDEGQDLLTIPVLQTLNNFIIGGFKDGNWLIFSDSNQNIFSDSKNYDEAIDYLKETARPCVQKLTKNCRNTKEIGQTVATVTHSKYSTCSVSGPKVEKKHYSDSSELSKILSGKVTALITASGLRPSDIIILSPKKKCNSDISFITSLNGYKISECENIQFFDKNCINYFTVQSFKGLEAKAVLMIDIDGFSDEESRKLNYVGLSRAKMLLCMYYKKSSEDDFLQYYCTGSEYL